MLYNCHYFESLLKDREDYFDCTIQSIDLQTIGRSNIIKFDGLIYVPEEFDITQTIQKYKNIFMDSITSDFENEMERILQDFF